RGRHRVVHLNFDREAGRNLGLGVGSYADEVVDPAGHIGGVPLSQPSVDGGGGRGDDLAVQLEDHLGDGDPGSVVHARIEVRHSANKSTWGDEDLREKV